MPTSKQQPVTSIPPAVTSAPDPSPPEPAWVAAFLSASCVVDPDGKAPAGALFNVYRRWCWGVGKAPLGPVAFTAAMRTAGVESHRARSGRFWLGLRLVARYGPSEAHTRPAGAHDGRSLARSRERLPVGDVDAQSRRREHRRDGGREVDAPRPATPPPSRESTAPPPCRVRGCWCLDRPRRRSRRWGMASRTRKGAPRAVPSGRRVFSRF
jgi:hypothetical protein